MTNRTFVYVDGESHFIRSDTAWRQIHGEEACLERLRYVGQTDDRMVLSISKAKVFWTRKMSPGALRAVYFTSAVGNDADLHQIRVTLRSFDLEPALIPERNKLAAQRKNVLQTQQVIEKPKGVDIALAVQMLEHAYRQAFDVCHLYTSDADFVPLIEAVRAQGKQVHVYGYKNGLSDQSDLLHVPDLFTDLEEILRNECEFIRSE